MLSSAGLFTGVHWLSFRLTGLDGVCWLLDWFRGRCGISLLSSRSASLLGLFQLRGWRCIRLLSNRSDALRGGLGCLLLRDLLSSASWVGRLDSLTNPVR